MAPTRFLLLVMITAICAALPSGCATKAARPKQPAPAATAEQYPIQPGDVLMVTFAGEPDFNHQVRVDWNGRISLPYATDSLQAAGASVSSLARRITDYAVENKLVNDPRVQVLVLEFASQTFVVLGQVNLPGRYSFPRGVPARLDLEEAVALAGGYTRLARQSVVLVKRGRDVHKVDLRKLSTRPGQPRFSILPGDIITVAERIF